MRWRPNYHFEPEKAEEVEELLSKVREALARIGVTYSFGTRATRASRSSATASATFVSSVIGFLHCPRLENLRFRYPIRFPPKVQCPLSGQP